jgi:RHS repeat-associated protein
VNDGHYFYCGTGALATDYHKRICMMKYNYLTLPKSVQFRKGDRIEYVYDAAGVKRQTTRKVANKDMNYGYWSMSEPAVSDFNSNLTVTTDYWGNKVYVNSQLKYILTEEGYIEKTAGSNTYTTCYYLNDHLGNRRIVMDAAGAVKQVNNFYPSGTSIAEYPRRTDQGTQPYKYEGKELDRTNGLDFYDFEARAYDPVLMRFTRPDPLAEKYPNISPYAYCANNPLLNIDPTGEDYWSTNDPNQIRRFFESQKWSQSQNPIEDFNFSSWTHVTDAEFVGNLTFNDETNTFYSSYGTVEDGVATTVGVSIKANSVSNGSASINTAGGEIHEMLDGSRRRASGGLDNVYPEFAVIVPLRAGTSAVTGLAKWMYSNIFGSPVSTTNTFNANAARSVEKMGKAKGNMTGNHTVQNEQVDAVVSNLGLSQAQRQQLHRAIHGEGYGYQEILKVAKEMFNKR